MLQPLEEFTAKLQSNKTGLTLHFALFSEGIQFLLPKIFSFSLRELGWWFRTENKSFFHGNNLQNGGIVDR